MKTIKDLDVYDKIEGLSRGFIDLTDLRNWIIEEWHETDSIEIRNFLFDKFNLKEEDL